MPGQATTAKPEQGGILPQSPEVPQAPSLCRWSAWENGYQSGYRSAWSTIVRAWESFNSDCKRQDEFIQAIQRNEANMQASQTGKCVALGNQDAISDAVRITSEKCGQQCEDIGEIAGQFGGSLFCDIPAPMSTRSWLKCTRIGVDSCNRAFRAAVEANCNQRLDSWSFSNELHDICTPDDLGFESGATQQPGQQPQQLFSTRTFIGLPLYQWPVFKLDSRSPAFATSFVGEQATQFPGETTKFPSQQATQFPGETTKFPSQQATQFPGETTRFPGQQATQFPGETTHQPGMMFETTRQPGMFETTRQPGLFETTHQPGLLVGETTRFPATAQPGQQTTAMPRGPQ